MGQAKLIILALLASVLPCFAQPTIEEASIGAFNPVIPVLYIVQSENFENTGASGYQSPLFNGDSGNVLSKDTVNPMQGAQQLMLTNGQSCNWKWQSLTNEVYVWFTYSNRASSVNSEIGELDDNSGNPQGVVSIASGLLRVQQGSTQGSTANACGTANTKYYIKMHFKTDGTANAEFSTSGTFVGSGGNYCSVTGGSGGAVQRWYFSPTSANATNYMDQLNISYTDPGLSPPR